MAGKTVKVMRVRPRAAYRDQNDDAARRGMGQIIEVSQKVADNAKLMKREGYVRVTEESKPKQAVPPVPIPEERMPEPVKEPTPSNEADNAEDDKVLASPAARKLAEEHFIDLTQVVGTGKSGYITKGDVANLTK